MHELFWGGARGAGKSELLIGLWADHANKFGKHAQGILLRRRYKQLEELLRRTHDLYPKLGARYSVSSQQWSFPNGATLKLRHLFDARDTEEYQGHEYSWLGIDELTNFPTPEPLDRMRACLRSRHGVPVQIRLTGNPGGPGHQWVKARYVDPSPRGYQLLTDPETGLERVFIPARLEDNPALTEKDPLYEVRLLQSGPPSLVKAWRWGIWDIVAGGFFDDLFVPSRHMLPVFQVPTCWRVRVSFDWGSARPSSFGIWAEVTDAAPDGYDLPRVFPRGSLIRTQEWYTVARDPLSGHVRPNVGMRLSSEDVGAGIAARLANTRRPKIAVADPSIFTQHGGPSIHERMVAGAAAEGYRLSFAKADNSRTTGWQRVRSMLEEAAKDQPEYPGLWVSERCENWIRTVPVVQQDPANPDDVDTDAEDHAADDTRYCVMARSRRIFARRMAGF